MSATYAIGRGKPPEHSRFKKGQSGNPSGKPGAEKTFKGRLRRTVEDTLARNFDAVRERSPVNVLDRAVHHLVLDAADGNTPAMRLLLKLMDDTERCATKRGRNTDDRSPFSLPQGKKQGRSENAAPAREKPEPEQVVAKRQPGKAGNVVDTTGKDARAHSLDIYFASSFLDTLSGPELEKLAAIQIAVEKADEAKDVRAFDEGQAAFEAFLQTLHAHQIDAYLTSVGAIPPAA